MLVNAAGIDGFKRFQDLSFEAWQRVIDVNLNGVFHCIQAVLPDMIDAGWGRIVNISSSSAHSGQPFMAHYVAAKSAVNGLTKALALELGPDGITVNAVPPGFIDTPMLRQAEERERLGGPVAGPHRADPGPADRSARGHRRRLRIPGLRGGRVHHRPDPGRQRRAEHVSAREEPSLRGTAACARSLADVSEVGFVGAGRMGRPMVDRLLAAGHPVRVLARSAEAGDALAAAGAEVVGEVDEVGAGVDAVLVCVHHDDQVRSVCLESGLLDRMKAGSVLVVHTTGSPHTVAAIAERAADRGIDVVDAPVSGGPHDIAAGRLTLFVGGAAAAVDRIRPVLASYGEPVLPVGPLGAGQRVKLINNALFAANLGLLADAARLGTRFGLDEAVLLSALQHGSAQSRALTGAAARGSVAGFGRAIGEFLHKDLRVVRAVAGDLRTDLGALDDALANLTMLAEA